MPLPLLEKPLAPVVSGLPPKSLNTEISGYVVASSTRSAPGTFSNYVVTTTERHFVKAFDAVALQDFVSPSAPVWMFPTNVGVNALVGVLSSVRPAALQAWSGATNANPARWRFSTAIPAGLAAGAAPALVLRPAPRPIHPRRRMGAPGRHAPPRARVRGGRPARRARRGTPHPPGRRRAVLGRRPRVIAVLRRLLRRLRRRVPAGPPDWRVARRLGLTDLHRHRRR